MRRCSVIVERANSGAYNDPAKHRTEIPPGLGRS
jgi:hypothetical protein